MKVIRKIVKIDEEKCNGCGLCIPNCPEGALQIIDGKAKLVSEVYCDGLGACIGACPQGAITIEEREAEEFDEKAVKRHLGEKGIAEAHVHEHPPMRWRAPAEVSRPSSHVSSALSQWPVQLTLVHPQAPCFQDADLLVVADCVPFAYANFHQDFLKGKSIVIGCPKLDDARFYESKLAELFRQSNIRSVTVINMEVPCCYGLHFLTQKALQNSGGKIPMKQVIISVRGERKE
ncbi:MAG: hypothetical protein AYL33_003310 [Candidatus Bathyarchaeota archaeon B63]|nr:MAG: hypothetical protein AYL33_003310 [Candidatus Bathyarchaeota archaeon B63]